MAKTKHEEDLRFAPADESMSDVELQDRADRLARAAISGGASRRQRPQAKPRKQKQPDAA